MNELTCLIWLRWQSWYSFLCCMWCKFSTDLLFCRLIPQFYTSLRRVFDFYWVSLSLTHNTHTTETTHTTHNTETTHLRHTFACDVKCYRHKHLTSSFYATRVTLKQERTWHSWLWRCEDGRRYPRDWGLWLSPAPPTLVPDHPSSNNAWRASLWLKKKSPGVNITRPVTEHSFVSRGRICLKSILFRTWAVPPNAGWNGKTLLVKHRRILPRSPTKNTVYFTSVFLNTS